MKKNNKFRNNGNSNAYSLNYKFDSVSPAGKYNGTALDLIKRYNELAKEAHSSGNYIEMEVFRQYAEHYRKIVTEINERKNMRQDNPAPAVQNQQEPINTENAENGSKASKENIQPVQKQNNLETQPSTQEPSIKKSFKIVEIQTSAEDIKTTEQAKCSEKKEDILKSESPKTAANKPKRQIRRKNETNLENEVKTVAAV